MLCSVDLHMILQLVRIIIINNSGAQKRHSTFHKIKNKKGGNDDIRLAEHLQVYI